MKNRDTKESVQNLAREDGLHICYNGRKRVAYCHFNGAVRDLLIQKYTNKFQAIGYTPKLSAYQK